MATHKITFDPSSGISYGVNLVINTGADFKDTFITQTTSGSSFNFGGWTGSSQIAKSVSIGSTTVAKASFNVDMTEGSDGKIILSLDSSTTRTLKEGRYVYDVLVSSGTTAYRIANGNVLVLSGISSAP